MESLLFNLKDSTYLSIAYSIFEKMGFTFDMVYETKHSIKVIPLINVMGEDGMLHSDETILPIGKSLVFKEDFWCGRGTNESNMKDKLYVCIMDGENDYLVKISDVSDLKLARYSTVEDFLCDIFPFKEYHQLKKDKEQTIYKQDMGEKGYSILKMLIIVVMSTWIIIKAIHGSSSLDLLIILLLGTLLYITVMITQIKENRRLSEQIDKYDVLIESFSDKYSLSGLLRYKNTQTSENNAESVVNIK